MFTRLKIGVVAMLLSLPVVTSATPAAPAKKAAGKHHGKTIPARHNAGRRIHP